MARVNGDVLWQRDFSTMLPEDYQRVLTVDERREYLERWIVTELLYDEAVRSGRGNPSDLAARLERYKKDLVAEFFVQDVIKKRAVVSEREVRAYYDAHFDEYTKEYRVSHILVNTLEDAEEVQELLQKKSFSWVARRHSIDRHTGVGGDLGFLSKGNMIPEFEPVVFSMSVGDVSDVIESEFGYHIIKLTDVRESRNKLEFEEAADEIARTLLLEKRAEVYDSLTTALREGADIEILDPEMKLMAEEVEPPAIPDVGADTLSTPDDRLPE